MGAASATSFGEQSRYHTALDTPSVANRDFSPSSSLSGSHNDSTAALPQNKRHRFRDRALQILASREHSAWDLRCKLLSKGCPEEEAQELVAEFVDLGYVDDVRFGSMLVRVKARQGWGAQRIKNELVRHGVRGDALDAVLQECQTELDVESEEERAAEVVRRRLRTPDDAERVFRYLVSHGYSVACACRVLEPYRTV